MKRTPVQTEVIVVGAGYAGVLAVNRLAALGHRVTLVNDREVFVERIRLHQVVAGTLGSAGRPLRDAVDPRVALVAQRAVRILTGTAPGVVLTDGTTLRAPHVVLAQGSGAGNPISTPEGASALRTSLAALPAHSMVRIDGAGPTGVEVVTELATTNRTLRFALHDPAGVLPHTRPIHRRWLVARLEKLGVELRIDPGCSALTIDCTGLTVPDLARDSGLPVAPDGRVLLEETLAVQGHPGLWAAGDAGVISSRPLRMACAVAEPMGAHVADAIDAVAHGRVARPFSLGFMFQCVSLGRRDAIIIFVHRDDSATRFRLTGRAGALFKEAICRLALLAPTRFAPAYRWAKACDDRKADQ